VLQLQCVRVVCTLKKISPSEIKCFLYVIIVVLSVFHLFCAVRVVCNGGSCLNCEVIYPPRMFNIVSSFECMILLVISL
jgi:succinate dehydrogenase/fumarate reductase cytochrome b subunit